jgi:hypothetical protein
MLVRVIAAVLMVSGMGWVLLRVAETKAAWREPIGRGEKRAIELELPAGQMVAVQVDQVEIGLTLSVVGPGGRVVKGGDRGGFGRETLLFETKTAGEYEVVVQADTQGPRRGHFALAGVNQWRMRASEEAGLRGQALLVEAADLEGRLTGETRERAVELYGEAAREFRAGGWHQLEGVAKNSEGRALDRGGAAGRGVPALRGGAGDPGEDRG